MYHFIEFVSINHRTAKTVTNKNKNKSESQSSRMHQHQTCNSKRLLFALVCVVALSQIAFVASTYIPRIGSYNQLMRRSSQNNDADNDDEMDRDASAPYQQGGKGGDGYEENEPDGPYDETPREQEGQADLEKFFDDHLGASERDGMDKENLPSNIQLVKAPLNSVHGIYPERRYRRSELHHESERINKPFDSAKNIEDFYSSQSPQTVNATTNFYGDNDADSAKIEHNPKSEPRQDTGTGSAPVFTTEDEDLDRIYVTNMTNKPFKIEALGGFDPEEDFRDATRDLEEPTKFNAPLDDSKRTEGKVVSKVKDIIFTDPETDTLYNDASETDEVTFGREDDAELDEPDSPDGNGQGSSGDETSANTDDGEEKKAARPRKGEQQDDDSDGGWVNDGVEDMDIPSQSHQDRVLNKAAERQALAERNAAAANDSNEQQPQAESKEQDEESQRMPNADYMKDDMQAEIGSDSEDALA